MNWKRYRRISLTFGVLACMLMAPNSYMGISTSTNSVLYVKVGETGTCTGSWSNACDLQTALGIATTGHEIWVASGTYKPTGGTDRTATFQLKNGVELYGGFAGTESSLAERDWQKHKTVLSGDIEIADDNNDNSYHVVTGSYTNANAILDGFIITGGNANDSSDHHAAGGGMRNDEGSPTLRNITFNGNSAALYGGGMLNVSSSPTLINVAFIGNRTGYSDSYGGGMYNYISSPNLTNVTFSGNSAYYGGGIGNTWGSIPTLNNCILWGNSAVSGAEIYNDGTSSATVSYSDIRGGWSGMGNINLDPKFVDVDGADDIFGTLDDNLRLQLNSPAIDSGDNTAVPVSVITDLDGYLRIVNGVIDMGAYEAPPAIIYVDKSVMGLDYGTSWADAFNDLSDALIWAIDGVEIWVADGTYKPTDGGDRIASFWPKVGVELYGGFAGMETSRAERDWENNITVLSGDIDNNDITDAYDVVTDTVNIIGDNSYHVVTGSGTDPTTILDGFTITGGKANGSSSDLNGGGMYNHSGSPTLINVTFSGNSATQYGGGMYNHSGSPTLTNVTFSGSSSDLNGGGMYNNSGSPTLTNVTFSGNSSLEGGGMYNIGGPTMTNVTFSGNSAVEGGGMYSFGGPELTNVTFSGNSADSLGGGIFHYMSNLALTNCILWGNTAPSGAQIYNFMSTNATVSYSLVQDGCPSGVTCDHLKDVNPQFVDADGADEIVGTLDDNLRLQLSSPAIDAGDNSAVPGSVITDLDGYPRFANIPGIPDSGLGTAPIVDMGACEAQLEIFLPLVLR